MTNRIDVDITRLRQIVNLIFDHIETDLGVTKITLDQDDYWHALSPEKFNVLAQPALGIGKLSDDWEFLSATSNDRREAVALMLTHAAPLLEYLGEQVGQ
jgi:hypothetical protein